MAVDTTTKAEAKWAELSRAESATIDKVLKGTATKADTDRLLRLIKQYSTLAGDVFTRGVGIIENTADKRIAAEVKRREKGGNPMTDAETEDLVKEITASVYQERGGDLMQAISEMVESANESMSQFTEDQYDDAVRESKSQYDELIRRLQGKAQGLTSKEPTTPTGKTIEDVLREVDESNSKEEDLIDDLMDEANASPNSPRGKADAAARRSANKEATENWASVWWRKFGEYSSSFAGKAKDTGVSLLTDLAKLGGLAYIFSPVFRKWIDDKLSEIGNFFTMDNVQKLLGEAWEFIKKEASEFTNYLKELVGFKEYTKDDVVKETKDLTDAATIQQKKADESQAKVDALQKDIDTRNKAAENGSLFDKAAAAVENHGSEMEKRREEVRKNKADAKKKKIEENIALNESTLGKMGGAGGSTAAAPPDLTPQQQYPLAPPDVAAKQAAKDKAAPTSTSANQPPAEKTATSVAGSNIETAANPPAKDSSTQSPTSANDKSVVPPAGGGGEGYVPKGSSPLLNLSNMLQ